MRRSRTAAGFTLIELIVAVTILVILTGAAVPLARLQIQREREHQLRADLWEMRDAIDRYKDAADRNLIRVAAGTEGYPPDLETLVNGVEIVSQGGAGQGGLLPAPGGIGGAPSLSTFTLPPQPRE